MISEAKPSLVASIGREHSSIDNSNVLTLPDGKLGVIVHRDAPGLLEHSFEIWRVENSHLFGLVKGKKKRIAWYEIERVDNHNPSPLQFLDLPSLEGKAPVYMGDMHVVEYEGSGLGRILFDRATNWMRLHNCIHLAVFSPKGSERLRHKFERLGYVPCSVINAPLAKQYMREGYAGWMYKHYYLNPQ